jgi:site-specific DNA recombinase
MRAKEKRFVTAALRCAAYARYSTDRQNPLSTQDQIEKCRQFAVERGWKLADDQVYTDEEISGATLDRTGLRSLLSAAESRPRPFDALLIEDSSRLSRKQADVLNLCDRLNFAGVKIHFISQGIDSGDEKFQLLLLARGMIDQLFLADTAKRVRRGLEGLLRRGLHTGGRCYGYRSRKDADGTRLEIHEPEAQVVRRIFGMYANGRSLKAIAKELNADRIASPQPQKGRLSQSWCPSSIRTILHNCRYTGKVVWNRKQKVRDPRTGRRVFRVREGEQPIHAADAPHLRIVADELWSAVKARQELVKRVYQDAKKAPGLMRSSAMNSPYLFSGLLRCKNCGANLQIVAGRGRNHSTQTYGCPTNFHRGDSICSNRLRVRRDTLERELLGGLQEKVLREDVATYILDRFEGELVKQLQNIGGELDGMRKRKAELKSEIARLAAGLATGVHSPAVMEEITRREREISDISDRLLSADPQSIHSRVKELREKALDRIRDLRQYLANDTPTARAYLTRHVERIVMDPAGGRYIASGGWNLLGDGRWDGAEGQS